MKYIKWVIQFFIVVIPTFIYSAWFLSIPNTRGWYDFLLAMFFALIINYYFIAKASEFGKWFDSKLKQP